jgi:hypothetical protein
MKAAFLLLFSCLGRNKACAPFRGGMAKDELMITEMKRIKITNQIPKKLHPAAK